MFKYFIGSIVLLIATTSAAQCPIVYFPHMGRFFGIDSKVIPILEKKNYSVHPAVEQTVEEVRKYGDLYLRTHVIWSSDFDVPGDCFVSLDVVRIFENGAQVVIDSTSAINTEVGINRACTGAYQMALDKLKACSSN